MSTRKLIAGITLGGLLMSGGLPAFAQTASTTSASSLQALIESLQAQIAALQAKLDALHQAQQDVQTAASNVQNTLQMIAQLRQGMTGGQVTLLQTILAADPSVYPEGLVTGYYGSLTAAAVKRFQEKHDIEQVGIVGPKTLKALNQFLDDNPIEQEKDDQGEEHPCAFIPPGHMIAPGWLRKVSEGGGDNGQGQGRGEDSIRGEDGSSMRSNKGHDHGDNEDQNQNQNEDQNQNQDNQNSGDQNETEHFVIPPCNGTSTPPVVTSTMDTTAPVITSVSASGITSNSAAITWTTNENATSKVWYSTVSGFALDGSTPFATSADTGTSHSVSLTGLSASTTYFFVVTSADASGNTSNSAQSMFTTGAAANTAAPVISAVSVTDIAQSSAIVHWSTNEDATSFVYYSTNSPVTVASTTPSASTAGFALTHAVTLSGLAASTTYHYVIVSADAANNSASSAEATFATAAVPDTTAPVISGVSVSAITSSTAQISWATDEPATSLVFTGTASPVATSTAAVSSASLSTSHSLTVSGLNASTTYFYVVSSADASANKAFSGESSFTTGL